MTESKVRTTIKSLLPVVVRRALRAGLHYFQRLYRWLVILYQVRGKTTGDQLVLIHSALYAPIVSFKSLMSWQDPVLIAPCHVVVKGFGEFLLRPRCDDLWHVLPWREHAIARVLKKTLRPGDVFIDAGANIGVYTVLASRLVGSEGRVISIEMMPDTADRLATHIISNGLENVTLVKNALSDISGQTVTASVQSDKYGQATIATDSARFGLGKQLAVETTTLDDVTQAIPRIRLMKIDLEGAELAALHGASSLLTRLDALVYESWGSKHSGTEPVDQLLLRNGYELHQLDGNNWLAEKVG